MGRKGELVKAVECPLLEAWTGLSRRDLEFELITPSGKLNGRQAAALVLKSYGVETVTCRISGVLDTHEYVVS